MRHLRIPVEIACFQYHPLGMSKFFGPAADKMHRWTVSRVRLGIRSSTVFSAFSRRNFPCLIAVTRPAPPSFAVPSPIRAKHSPKEERAEYGLSGLLPTAVSTVDQQVERMREMLNRFEKPIDKALLLDSIRNDE